MSCCPNNISNEQVFAQIDDCKEVVKVPKNCSEATFNWDLVYKLWEAFKLLKCRYEQGSDAIFYRYKEKLTDPVFFVTVAAGKLVGVDPNKCTLFLNGVQIYHTSENYGPFRFQFDVANDNIVFYDLNNAAISIGDPQVPQFIDLIIFK